MTTPSQTPETPIVATEAIDQHNQQIADAYDRQIYESNAFPFCAPGHLQGAAHLYGLSAVPLAQARVLELGCAGGGNLLPFALAYPEAHVVGVDLSANQVEQGQALVQELGLKNLHLHAMSLTDIGPDFGQFDYIISHGVFSWVPPEVRLAMLRILRENLSPQGLAYISYNTYPGWKAGDIVRDAMLLHSHGAQTDEDKLASAKAMLSLLSEGIAPNNPLAPSLRGAVGQLRQHSDYYIAHEYLETFNNPCYLLEFVDLARQQGVAHVGDVEPHLELAATYGQNVQLHHSLVALGQPRELRQQYLDFAVGRNFRKSLIVAQERLDTVPPSPDLERLTELRWAAYFQEVEAPANADPGFTHHYRGHKGQPLATKDPAVHAILETLSAVWPATLDYPTLAATARPQLTSLDDDAASKALQEALRTLFRLNSLRYTHEAGPYDGYNHAAAFAQPTLIPGVAALQARRSEAGFGIGLSNLWHETVRLQLKPAEAWLLPLLDGTQSQTQLRTRLRDALNKGTVPGTDGKLLTGQRNLDATAGKIVQNLLELLQRMALLR